MPISSHDSLLEHFSLGQTHLRSFFKRGIVAKGIGTWVSLWLTDGIPVAGSAPAAGSGSLDAGGTAYTNATGGLCFPDLAPTYDKLLNYSEMRIGLAGASAPDVVVMAYDRLVAASGISLATTGTKNVNTVPLPRYTGTDAADVECWLEVTTAGTGGATAVVSIDSYTNDAGTTGRSGPSVTLVANPTVGQMFPLRLAADDKGIRSVQTLDVTTLNTGLVCNVVLMRKLHRAPCDFGLTHYYEHGMQLNAYPQIYDGATIAFAMLQSTTTATDLYGALEVVYTEA